MLLNCTQGNKYDYQGVVVEFDFSIEGCSYNDFQ